MEILAQDHTQARALLQALTAGKKTNDYDTVRVSPEILAEAERHPEQSWVGRFYDYFTDAVARMQKNPGTAANGHVSPTKKKDTGAAYKLTPYSSMSGYEAGERAILHDCFDSTKTFDVDLHVSDGVIGRNEFVAEVKNTINDAIYDGLASTSAIVPTFIVSSA